MSDSGPVPPGSAAGNRSGATKLESIEGKIKNGEGKHMRKAITVMIGLALVVGMMAVPAFAGKKTTGGFDAVAPVPYPNSVADGNDAGQDCLASTEGVSRTTGNFKVPAAGKLTATMSDFQGDWDLYIFNKGGSELASSHADNVQGGVVGEKLVVTIPVKQTISIVACNWSGGPTATVAYKFVTK
jgi:hypothetical protein